MQGRRLIAPLACRNGGSRLYGKPLQNLDIESGLNVLQYMINWLKETPEVSDIILAIAEGDENLVYREIALENDIPFITGEEHDVLGRVIQSVQECAGTDLIHLTTESPYTYFEAVSDAWQEHIEGGYDLSCIDNVSDGIGFELVKLEAYERSHSDGEDRHRAEMCSLYIRENKDRFKINYLDVPDCLKRMDIRLTIDYPEDLILCRAVYSNFSAMAPRIPVPKILDFLDSHPELTSLVQPFVEEGLKTMFL